MNKKLLVLSSFLSIAHAKMEPYIGIQLGVDAMKGTRADQITLTQDQYTYKRHIKRNGGILGAHVGVSWGTDVRTLGIEIDANSGSARDTVKTQPLDSVGPTYRSYSHEISHLGGVAVGVRATQSLTPTVSLALKPFVSYDVYRSKLSYVETVRYYVPIVNLKKNGRRPGYGIAVGLDKRVGAFKVGAELKYSRNKTYRQNYQLDDVESTDLKYKPTHVGAMVRVSYCF